MREVGSQLAEKVAAVQVERATSGVHHLTSALSPTHGRSAGESASGADARAHTRVVRYRRRLAHCRVRRVGPHARVFLASIMLIRAITPPTLHTGRRQMHHPSQRQKHDQDQAIQTVHMAHMTRLPLPAATLQVLKGGLHAHAPAILRDSCVLGRSIRQQKPGPLHPLLPRPHSGVYRTHALSRAVRCHTRTDRADGHLRTGLPVVNVAVARALKRLLLCDARDVVPGPGLDTVPEV